MGELSKSAGDWRLCADSISEIGISGLREVPGIGVAP